ncbi:hypothetical protein GLYMA_10G046851v4 [Glycine max]|nr:hypothetical protein GLYMA_10G046851v4 [Glycine max]KAH1136773.1 hypothetical protein GYH30_026974 [Glycine max]
MCLCLSSTVLWISTLIEAQLVSCWCCETGKLKLPFKIKFYFHMFLLRSLCS